MAKRFTVIDGPMPRKVLSATREGTAHQSWNPRDLKNVVEGVEPKKSLNPYTLGALVLLAIGLLIFVGMKSL